MEENQRRLAQQPPTISRPCREMRGQRTRDVREMCSTTRRRQRKWANDSVRCTVSETYSKRDPASRCRHVSGPLACAKRRMRLAKKQMATQLGSQRRAGRRYLPEPVRPFINRRAQVA